MSVATIVRCDVSGCKGVRNGDPLVSVTLGAVTSNYLMIGGALRVDVHLCLACANTLEGHAFVTAYHEKAVAQLKGAKS